MLILVFEMERSETEMVARRGGRHCNERTVSWCDDGRPENCGHNIYCTFLYKTSRFCNFSFTL